MGLTDHLSLQRTASRVNKAPGHDGLPPRLLKMILKEIAPTLCTIFNTSIETAAWPETWQRGTWTPVFKRMIDMTQAIIDQSLLCLLQVKFMKSY